MALQESTISLPLLPMNEQAPRSAGPNGRLQRIENGIATKFDGGGLRVSKRPGFTPLVSTVRGGPGITTLPGSPRWLSGFRGQLVGEFGVQPYVYSATDVAWQGQHASGGAAIASKTLTKRPLFNGNTRAQSGDAAAVGDRLMFVFRTGVGGTESANLMLRDAAGTNLTEAGVITGAFRLKVVSDGVQFWVASQAAAMTSTIVQVFDKDGTQLATTTIAWGAARDHWDIRYAPGLGQVVLATPIGATTDMRFMTYAAAAITLAVHTTPAADCTNGVAFLDNSAGTNVYISGADATMGVRAFEVSSAGALTFTFPIDPANVDYVGNITGYAQFGGINATYVVVAYTFLQDNTASITAPNNQTRVWICDRTPTATLLLRQRSLSLASRAWHDTDGNYFVTLYYQSTACVVTGGGFDQSTLDAEPSFFTMWLSPTTPSIVGQFEIGDAAMFEGSRVSLDYYPWHLASAAADTNAVLHMPLGYMSEQANSDNGTFTGINEYMLAPTTGRPVETTDELLIPGLGARRFDGGTFSEDGLPLAPQYVSGTPAAPGNMNPGEQFWYAGVYEWLDAAGNIIESVSSVPHGPVSLGAGNHSFASVWRTLRCSSKTNVRLSIYRTFSPTFTNINGVILRKVGELANDPTADTLTFTDTFSDTYVSVGKEMYTQPLNLSAAPALDKYPAPAFSRGCVADGREFVIGYDGAIWFSSQKVEGFGQSFNPQLRIVLPTTAAPTSILPIDARMVVLAADGTAWTFPIGGLPNDTLTTGSIPQPEQLPFTTGSLGSSLVTPEGAIYASKVGPWLMDRAGASQFIGSPVIDELVNNLQIIDINVDSAQRIYFTLGIAGSGGTSSTMLVRDLVSKCWYVWTLPIAPVTAATWNGRYVFADTSTPGRVWLLDEVGSTTYTDNGAGIASTYELNSVSFAGVDGYQVVWETQWFGEYRGPHQMTVGIKYDQSDAISETLTQFITSDPGVYRYDILPKRIDCTAIGLTFTDGPSVEGDTFTLESIGFLVGIEKGLNRMSSDFRFGGQLIAPPAGPVYWFKPDVGASVPGAWSDQSGYGYDTINVGTSVHWPVLTPSVFPSGLGALDWGQDTQSNLFYRYFERINIAADPGPLKNLGARTVLALIKPDRWSFDTTRVGGIIVGHPNGSGFTWDAEMMVVGGHQETAFDGGFFWQLNTPVNYTGVPIVVATTWGGAGSATVSTYVNGVLVSGFYPGGNILRTGNGAVTRLDIGFDSGPSYTGHTFSGMIGEIICYAGTDPIVLAAATAYLKARGGIA